MAEFQDVAADLITASLDDARTAIERGQVDEPTGTDLADRIIAGLSLEEAQGVLAQLTAVATLLLIGVANHTDTPPEEVLLAIRRSLVDSSRG